MGMNSVQERPSSAPLKINPERATISKGQKKKKSNKKNVPEEVKISEKTKKFLKRERANLKKKEGNSRLTSKLHKIKEPIPIKNSPGIFFLSGLEIKNLSSDDEGVRAMAKNLPRAEHFSWDDEDIVLQEINRRPINQPIILVGHSLGGDAVVNLANRLNSMEYGFRNIDLLVTLDSVGLDNDLIPQNVRENLNFIGDADIFFNDGPNIARDRERTLVMNELRREEHTGIDDSKDVQKKIFSKIASVLRENRDFNDLIKSFAKS